ncbi:MAG: TIGR04255 family protein [Saprospiraceae bacterium]
MSSPKLKKAPLKEVIFELHWESGIDNGGIPVDIGFDLAQGKFADRLKSKFPVHKKLIPDDIKIYGAPIHQYWAGEFKWPCVQHGQGLMSVNQVEEDYNWKESYKPLVIDSIDKLIDSYEDQPKFNKVKLIYIDAYDLGDMEPLDFMKQNLQTNIVNSYKLPGALKGFNVHQTFTLNDLSVMGLNIFDGINIKNQEKSVIWTTTVEKQAIMPLEQISDWVEYAHTLTSTMFKTMLNSKFYDSLDR